MHVHVVKSLQIREFFTERIVHFARAKQLRSIMFLRSVDEVLVFLLKELSDSTTFWVNEQNSCLGGAVVGRRTRDRNVAGSTSRRGAINSTRSTLSGV